MNWPFKEVAILLGEKLRWPIAPGCLEGKVQTPGKGSARKYPTVIRWNGQSLN